MTKVLVEIDIPQREDEDEFTYSASSSIEFDMDEDMNAPAAMLMEEALRTLLSTGEIVNRFPELAPKTTAIITKLIAEEEVSSADAFNGKV